MLRKINTTLAVLCTLGAIFVGGVFAYTHISEIENSKIVNELKGGI